MKKLIIFIGDSGSGKTTVISRLLQEIDFPCKKIVTYTGRPKRGNEIDGNDYYFVDNEYITSNLNKFILTKETGQGWYATLASDLLDKNKHLLLTSRASAVPKLKSLGINNILVIEMIISEELKKERMRQRGDSEEMINNRIYYDKTLQQDTLSLIKDTPLLRLNSLLTIEEKILKIKKFINE